MNAFKAWIRLPEPDEIRGPAVPPNYNFGFVASMGRLLAAHPRIGAGFNRLFAEIMFAPGVLTRQEREMVAAVTAAAQDCHY